MRWFLVLMLVGCGEGSGEGGDMPAPDMAPACDPPEVQPCPEGTTYETRAAGAGEWEMCSRGDLWSLLVERRDAGVYGWNVDGVQSWACWPGGAVGIVRECESPAQCVEACYGTDRKPADCERVNAELSAAWR